MSKTPTPNEFPVYDTKQSNGVAPVMQELWGMWSTPSLPLLPGPFWPRLVATVTIISMSLVELFDILTQYKKMVR